MRCVKTDFVNILVVLCLVVGTAGRLSAADSPSTPAQPAKKLREVNIGGYMSVGHSQAPKTHNAGFSFYSAAWPLLEKYQGHRFQSGLYGTWMSAQYDGRGPEKLYSTIEGGLGWWSDTQFPTETPKFIMGGVGPGFSSIANGPGHGVGNGGLYGVAQLSPWLLFPLDGLNVRQGACGQLFGYGYLALPLTSAKATTDGASVPTGDRSWTLFLNTKNFKGPVAFFTPYFWSRTTVKKPTLAGMLLDSRPSEPNKPLSMETQYIPAKVFEGKNGESYFRSAVTLFPVDAEGNSVVMHRVTTYNEDALWSDVKRWFDGGPEVNGSINPQGAAVAKLHDEGPGWKIWPPKKREEPVPLAWKSIATPCTPDPLTFGYRFSDQLERTQTANGTVVKLPEYYQLTTNANKKPEWTPVSAKSVPADTKLASLNFDRPVEPAVGSRTTPFDKDSSWKKPGPAAGPFQARLGDGSVVTYYWYRFADQPAMLNAGLTAEEREQLQKRVEMIHRSWTKERDYLAPPTVGTLAELDPAMLVSPPKGKEVGYVPIVIRQEPAGAASRPNDQGKARLYEALLKGGRQGELIAYAKALGEGFWKKHGEALLENAKQEKETMRLAKRDLSAIGELVQRLEKKLLPVPGTEILMSKTELTVGEWKLYLRAEGYLKPDGLPDWGQPSKDWTQTDEHPVVNVSWNQAHEFCKWLSEKTGKGWRLPKNSEWEAAVGTTKYPWGEYYPPHWDDGNYAVLEDGKKDTKTVGVDGILGTAPVASFKPNTLGFYDLGGNVREWMLDGEDEKKGNRVYRGGSWLDDAARCCSSYRYNRSPDDRNYTLGFRLARVPSR